LRSAYWRRVIAWTLAVVAVASAVAGTWLSAQNGTGTAALAVILTLIVDGIVGAIVMTRPVPNNTGWILLGISLIGSVGWLMWDYGYRVVTLGPSWLPAGLFVFWLASWIWIPAFGVGLPSLLVRLPDGKAPARWARVDVLGAIGSAAVMLSIALMPGALFAPLPPTNPYGIPGAEGWLLALRWAGYSVIVVALTAGVAALVIRLNHARGDQREQLKWIVSGAAVSAVALVYGLITQVLEHQNLFDALTPFLVSTVALPATIGVAILHYRLYDIDLVINRALVYGGLTAMLAGLYTFWVGLTQRLVAFSGQKSDIALLLTAFAGAAAFTPVKSWLQKTVDRRFAVHDPASAVDSMREQIEVIVNVLDAQRIARRLVDDSATTYRARYVALALGSDGQAEPFHAAGDPDARIALRIMLHCQGRELGVLSLSERRGGLPYTPRDEKALQLCADAVAEAIGLWEAALRERTLAR